MSFPVTRVHGWHFPDLDPEWVREHRPWIEDPRFPVEIVAEEWEGDGGQGAEVADFRWSVATAGYPGAIRVVRDIDYGDWRQPTPDDVDAARRGKGHLRLDWGVRAGGDVVHYGYHDAASRALHNNTHGWELAVRDVTPSSWSRVGEKGC